jgi:hypothetical protein
MSQESVWNATNGVGSGLHFRYKNAPDMAWSFRSWQQSKMTPPKSRAEVVGLVEKANANPDKMYEYATTQCSSCKIFHNLSEWAGHLCEACMMKNKHDWMQDIDMKGKPKPLSMLPKSTGSNQFNSPIKKPVLVKREEGDVWEIPATSSPLWTKQWAYQGSAKEPYIISKKKHVDGRTSSDGWACSCRAFTQHSPRKDCKHIINIKHQFGLGPVNATKHAVANLDSEEAAAFAEFKRQKAQNAKQKPESGDAELNLFGATGRKFR